MTDPQGGLGLRTEPGRGRAAGVLVSAVAAAAIVCVVLLVVAVRSGSAAFAVGDPEAVPCPVGEGTPVCYRAEVLNVGSEPAPLVCDVTAAEGTIAVFFNGSSRYASGAALEPNAPLDLFVKVDADGGGVIYAPALACGAG